MVIWMNDEYYVYAYLREDGTPYYIGKGKGYRAYDNRGRPASTPTDRTKIVILLDNLTEEQAFTNEKDFIAFYGRKDNCTGILRNRTDGGEGASGSVQSIETIEKRVKKLKGRVISKEWRAKISKTLFEKNLKGERSVNFGRTASPETREKLRISHLGIKPSKEHREKLGKSQRGKRWINNGTVNSKMSKNSELPAGWVFGRLPFKWKKNISEKSCTNGNNETNTLEKFFNGDMNERS